MRTQHTSRVLRFVAGIVALAGLLMAQSPRLTFDVSSVKRSHSAANSGSVRFTPGGVTAENAPLRFIITFAYHIRDFQLAGAPGWTESERYEIAAKAEGKPNPDQLRVMLQSLLEDRFGLKIHRSTEQRTAYLLAPAKGGLRLPESAADCDALAGEPPAKDKSRFQCGAWFGSEDRFTATKISMAQFSEWLSDQLERPVLDRTGHTGLFDIDLHWSTDDKAAAPDAAPAIFTAVQEQMGMKIESGKGPVEILTIDRVNRPDAN